MAEVPSPPPWLSILLSHYSENHPLTKFAQLATLTTEGRPSVRTVVVREVTGIDGTLKILICTDMRSAKIDGLRRCEWAELCWYFTYPRIQFRLTGPAHIADETDPDRHDLWRKLSNNARRSYYTPAPGSAISKLPPEEKNDNYIDFNEMPPSFALLVFKPNKVDVVDLVKSERRIWEYELDSQKWNALEVYP